jgi:LCP family protein required for cell wall assembly
MRNLKGRSSRDRLTLILAAAFVIIAIVACVVAYNMANDLVRKMNSVSIPGAPDLTRPTVVNAEGTPIPADVPLQTVSGPPAETWDGASRVTILLIGLDFRDWENGDVPRSDSMILLTIDPLSKTAGMLSIPRDMWVNIPDYGYAKINTAYFLGAANRLPGGGPGLALKTVRDFLGVPINYYAQIDFGAFVKFIDALGGIPINVPEDITVDPLGKGNTVLLRQGKMIYGGDVALAYARARHTEGGDFDRAKRQQQVIMGIRERIVKLDMLPTLIAKSSELYQQLSDGIKTNLTIDQAVKLALLATQISTENIKKGVLGTTEVTFAKSSDGLDILIPIPDKIRLVRDNVFTTGGPVSPAAVGQDPKALMDAEKAKVSVRNGSTTSGLAAKTSTYLKGQGVNIVDEATADRAYEATELVIYSGKPYTAQFLAKLFNIPSARILNKYDPNAQFDIVINLGRDWANKNPMP